MNLEKFKELRVVVKDAINPRHNGKTYSILYAELNDFLNEVIVYVTTDDGSILSLYISQIAYVKVFDHYSIAYYDKLNKTNLDVPFELSQDEDFVKIGSWDVYTKEFNILDLVE